MEKFQTIPYLNNVEEESNSSTDPEGGGGPGIRTPPPRFVWGMVLCRGLMVMRGGPTVIFTLLLSFLFLASFARQYYTNILLYYYMYTYR